MTVQDPKHVWKYLKELYLIGLEAAIDAKLSRLQQIRISLNKLIIKYTNRIDALVNEVKSAGHHDSAQDMKRALLRE